MPKGVKYHHKKVCDKKKFDSRSFRVKEIGKKIKMTLGCPKGKWSAKSKRCKVGTVTQKFLFPKAKYTAKQASAWMRKHRTKCPVHRF